MKIFIINGPNLANIGDREPEIYGYEDFGACLKLIAETFPFVEILYFQSHSEGEIVNKIYETEGENFAGIILNAGAYSHTSFCIRDAVAAVKTPTVMVHISNVYAREQFRHDNVIAGKCKGVITGFGLKSYLLAVESLL